MTEIQIKLDRLQTMMESEIDPDKKATLRWAIYKLIQDDNLQNDNPDINLAIQETICGAVIATMHNLNMSETDRDDLMNTLIYDTLQNPNYNPETLRSIYSEWRNRDII